jgi:hypothetical protein
MLIDEQQKKMWSKMFSNNWMTGKPFQRCYVQHWFDIYWYSTETGFAAWNVRVITSKVTVDHNDIYSVFK